MRLEPDATLDSTSLSAIVDAYGLGEPLDAVFVARGAMGAINRVGTLQDGAHRSWTVKRSFWNQYSEQAIAREAVFTRQCASVGVPAPRSIERVDGSGYVLTMDDLTGGTIQYRVLEWVDGEIGRLDDPGTIPPLAEWMARIHTLAIDPAEQPIDPWFIHVGYDWDDLADQLEKRAPDVAEQLRMRRGDIQELTDLVNSTRETGAVWCHSDIAANNLVWANHGPQLIDWEDSGPLVPRQQLANWVRSLALLGKSAYHAYRQAGGPAEITEVAHIASSVAGHLNYVGSQAKLLLDATYVEHHEFAREQVTGATLSLPNLHALDQWIRDFKA